MGGESRLAVAGFVAALAAAVGFGVLAHLVMQGDTQAFDVVVRDGIHSWASPVLTLAMHGITQLGSLTVLIPLGALVVWRLWRVGRPRAAFVFAIAAAGAVAFDQVLKFSFRRPRPEVFFGLPQPLTYSFPSGHSVESCCFYGVLAALLAAGTASHRKKTAIWTAAGALTLAIGISRVYLGVHYPTDVLGGYAVAVVWVATVRAGYGVWRRRKPPPSIS